MNHSAFWASVMRILLLAGCAVVIISGISLTFKGASVPLSSTVNRQADSTFTYQTINTDTAGSKRTTAKSDTIIVRKTTAAPGSPAATTNTPDNLMKRGYDLIFFGIILLLIFYALPYLSEFSFLQLFSAKFRATIESQRSASNEATNAANSNVTTEIPATVAKPLQEEQKRQIKNILQSENTEVESYAAYRDDPQKGKWGKLSYRNERKMIASVTPLSSTKDGKALFKVGIKVISTNPLNPLTGAVKFHLHPSFAAPDPIIFPQQGAATLELTAWGAFTVGAEADGGVTLLELDLAELPEAPLLFRAN